MSDYIPVNTPLLNGNEKKYLNQCIESGWISSEGPFVKALEENLAKKVNRQYGVAVCNGSVALELAVKALEIGEGDEVIMPTFTIVSCVLAVIRAGAVPVLVDSDLETWNMDVSQIESKITPRTKAIMVVHIYGLPVEMAPILALAKKYDLKIIEDAAEMLGQTYYEQPCGSFGDISTFSFYPNKLVTTGEGGMVVTNDPKIAERAQLLRNLAFTPHQRYHHEEMGWNFRMSNLQAAVGLAQFERWDEFVNKKRAIGHYYTEHLKELSELQLPITQTAYAENIYWVYGIVLKEPALSAAELMSQLHQQGIGCRAFFYPMHCQPVFLKRGLFQGECYPNAEKLAEKGLYIPSGLALTEAQMECVVKKVKFCLHAKVSA